jgi:integrase
MGIFQRYIKTDKTGNPIIGKDGKPQRQGPWFMQYPYARNPETGKIRYRTEKASFSKKKAEKMWQTKVDSFQEKDKFGTAIDIEMTFSELIDWGLKQEIMQAKASIDDDRNRAKHLKAYFGECKAVQITPLMVDNFRIRMKKTKSDKTGKCFSGSTINKMVSLGRRIYYLAIDAGIVNHNPFARRGVFKEEPRGKYIPHDQFRKIQDNLIDYLKPVAITAYNTGMRRGELLNLKWERVNLFKGHIDLSPEDTKTEEPRIIYFSSNDELKDVFVEAAKNRMPKQINVFVKPNGEPVPKWYMERLFKKACQDAGVGPYRFHDLRHTFNTNMLKAGVSTKVIMKLTGHKTDAMFTRYTHLDEELGSDAMQKLVTFMEGKKDEGGQTDQKKESW